MALPTFISSSVEWKLQGAWSLFLPASCTINSACHSVGIKTLLNGWTLVTRRNKGCSLPRWGNLGSESLLDFGEQGWAHYLRAALIQLPGLFSGSSKVDCKADGVWDSYHKCRQMPAWDHLGSAFRDIQGGGLGYLKSGEMTITTILFSLLPGKSQGPWSELRPTLSRHRAYLHRSSSPSLCSWVLLRRTAQQSCRCSWCTAIPLGRSNVTPTVDRAGSVRERDWGNICLYIATKAEILSTLWQASRRAFLPEYECPPSLCSHQSSQRPSWPFPPAQNPYRTTLPILSHSQSCPTREASQMPTVLIFKGLPTVTIGIYSHLWLRPKARNLALWWPPKWSAFTNFVTITALHLKFRISCSLTEMPSISG